MAGPFSTTKASLTCVNNGGVELGTSSFLARMVAIARGNVIYLATVATMFASDLWGPLQEIRSELAELATLLFEHHDKGCRQPFTRDNAKSAFANAAKYCFICVVLLVFVHLDEVEVSGCIACSFFSCHCGVGTAVLRRRTIAF